MLILDKFAKTREPTPVSPLTSYILHLTSRRSSLQFPAWRIVVARATLIVATLGDVLLARCCGSCLRVNLLPTHLIGELAAELGGYGATQSALAFSISAVATFRVPRPSGDGYNAGGYIALWLLALRWCSGEQSSESAAIPFGGIAQTSNVSVPWRWVYLTFAISYPF